MFSKFTQPASLKLLEEHITQLASRGYSTAEIQLQLISMGIPGRAAASHARQIAEAQTSSGLEKQARPPRQDLRSSDQ